jgi:hypothetical protein
VAALRLRLLILSSAAFEMALAPASKAQPPLPVGGQFQVNTYTTSTQGDDSAVAMDSDGRLIVTWNSFGSAGTDGSTSSVQGQRYDAHGDALGAEFQVNTYTTNAQRTPDIAAASNGDFVVVWSSDGSPGTDTSLYSVQGQRYASDGEPQGSQFQINSYTTNYQFGPSVAAMANGDFVVVWWSDGSPGTDTSLSSIQGRRFASDGSPEGAQFQVNTYTSHTQISPVVAAASDGDFVVVWTSFVSSPGTDSNVEGQRYASDGSTQGGQFQVNAYTTSEQDLPSVAMSPDGEFVVTWTSRGSTGTDTSGVSIQGQRYASDGSTQGGQFQVNTYTTSDQLGATVAADGDGGFVVTWESTGSSGTIDSIQGQRYGPDGAALGGEFQVNTHTTGTQSDPSVGGSGGGVFTVTWFNLGAVGNDPDASIQGQRFRPPIAVPALSPGAWLGLGALLLLGGILIVPRSQRRGF